VARARVGVVGASGFGGAELVRLITAHPDLDLALVAAHRRAGERLDGLAPNLVTDIVLAEVDPAALSEIGRAHV
jgi:N-acetyl-gamma-glutamyl-phosphate reductase